MSRILTTQEVLQDGRHQLSMLTPDGWLRHVFESEDELKEYEQRILEGVENAYQ